MIDFCMSKPQRPLNKCAILDCFNPTKSSGLIYCSKHYLRFKKHGDPNITLRNREPNLGQSQDPLYKRWWYIICRCEYKNHRHYKDYGGRGIQVYPPWRSSFLTFRKYIISTIGLPEKGVYLDRIDNNGNYEPGNIKWSTSKESAQNRRIPSDAHLITYKGETLMLTEWAKKIGITHSALIRRLAQNWPLDKALTAKKYKFK